MIGKDFSHGVFLILRWLVSQLFSIIDRFDLFPNEETKLIVIIGYHRVFVFTSACDGEGCESDRDNNPSGLTVGCSDRNPGSTRH